jgi:hypothetical protein
MVSGETILVLKKVLVQLTSGVHWQVWVFIAKITSEFILGLDVLCAHFWGTMCCNWAMKNAIMVPQGVTVFICLCEEKQQGGSNSVQQNPWQHNV